MFNQHNANAPKGELIYGEDFVIEVLKNGEWEEAPIPLECHQIINKENGRGQYKLVLPVLYIL